ncbi:hypothetical protein [Smaragdicoccus niigatensis]|uniref:hypothetical protein n=1 Tax=Smaragdicoccus niigatensis TaxID=359359 RepID=UPI000364B1B6|nr:hypothetical protein [Smaragdicoccus niigatensis]
MSLNRKFRMAAGTAAITIAAALAMPGIASAGGGHHHDDGDDYAATAEHRGDAGEADHHGDDADHHRGDAPCDTDKTDESKPAAPAAKTTTYPTQSKTGSISVPNSSDSGIVLITLAAATALGGVAVRRATAR